jgi:hypothetical protein
MLTIDHERREGVRISLTRPCKVFEPRSSKYIAGSTCNASPSGLLLRLHRSMALEVGDRLYVAIPPRRRSVLLRSAEMIEVEVVRTLPITSGETAIAVTFVDPAQETYLPVVRRAA